VVALSPSKSHYYVLFIYHVKKYRSSKSKLTYISKPWYRVLRSYEQAVSIPWASLQQRYVSATHPHTHHHTVHFLYISHDTKVTHNSWRIIIGYRFGYLLTYLLTYLDRRPETKQRIKGKIVRYRLGRVRDRVRDKDRRSEPDRRSEAINFGTC